MIVSWNWLKEYVKLDMRLEDLVERLTMAGLNHEQTIEIGGDIAIDLEVTSNRPDCLGHIGIAREVAVLFGHQLNIPSTDFSSSRTAIEERTRVEVTDQAKQWCPQYRARLIEGVRIGPSPTWMQRRLKTVGLTPINNVVDITNYVLLECGQPLHAFDFEKLLEHRIVVRNALPGERFVAINNKEYELAPSMGVIADGRRAVAVAGVMGGAATEVSNETTTVLLESAEFSPISIRRTSRALDLSSESSYRFERKVDPAGIAWASERACQLLAELAGGRVAKGFIHAGQKEHTRDAIVLRVQRCARILGIEVHADEIARILNQLGLAIQKHGSDSFTVVPPTFRRDLTREIDLIEEVGRIHGYEAVAEDRFIPLTVAPSSKRDKVLDRIRDSLCASGYFESVTFSFVDSATCHAVRPWSDSEPLAVQHSSRKRENTLRQSVIPSLLSVLGLNQARGNEDIELFEIASIYFTKDSGMPSEPTAIALVSNRDIREVRGHLDFLFESLRIAPQLVPFEIAGLSVGRTAEYRFDGRRMGVIGYVDRHLADHLDLRGEVVAAEILVEPLVENASLVHQVRPVPAQPSMARDLAIVLDESVRWADLESVVLQAAPKEMENLEFVDLFRGKQVPPGKKSIAFRMSFRAMDRTLTREEVDRFQQGILDAIHAQLGGTLRA